jgi:nanoRNase/pAp phosphatase (c-di-AMP/oligoRNAs hydrolase)
MKCFYHNDSDGKCAAFWVYNTKKAADDYDRYFQVVDYDRPFPIDMIKPGEMVWIVDFSVEPEDMEKIIDRCGLENVFWIDHHKTAIAKFDDFPHEIQGVRESDKAACELTYEFTRYWSLDLNPGDQPTFEEYRTSVAPPMFTQLIADRDVWRWQYGKATKYFYAGSQLLDLRPFSAEWNKLLSESGYCEQIQENGKLIEQFRSRQRHIDMSYFGYEVIFEGYHCMAVNGTASGDLGQDIREQGYEIAIIYRHSNSNNWIVSLYSDEVDVGEVARKYGGGGHRGAAGFNVKQDPNTLWETRK